jgi:hypothetical protein
MLADIEAWLLGKTNADINADMEAYQRVVRHTVLLLPVASGQGHCIGMALEVIDLQLWL